jgi:hypothetical protein
MLFFICCSVADLDPYFDPNSVGLVVRNIRNIFKNDFDVLNPSSLEGGRLSWRLKVEGNI